MFALQVEGVPALRVVGGGHCELEVDLMETADPGGVRRRVG